MRVAFIPVRGGSKSIPLKNIRPLAGKPLIYWTMEAALHSGVFDHIYISTDSPEIEEVVVKHQQALAFTLIKRSAETATDKASTESAMLEFAEQFDFDEIALIQATSPLLKSEHIREAFEQKKHTNVDSLLTVCVQERFIWEEGTDGRAKPINYDPLNRPRRQDFEGLLVENGAMYITSKESLLATKCRISGTMGVYKMPPESYFEIDEPSDWQIAEALLKKDQSKNTPFTEVAASIKLFLSDVDGVLTDAGMYYTEFGDELKKFNTRDGMGFQLIREQGIKTGLVTSEITNIVKQRAKKLKIDFLHQGKRDHGKLEVAQQMCEKLGITLQEVAYIGDDINCLELIKAAGLSACPADAVDVIKEAAMVVCNKKGGEGCVREFAEMILAVRN
ncbi:N-acylneuraminate cytidylyltransferase [Balneola vulgaris]|uniref:N-acylneuraminate cytidylyltransferase n=1 Tax=Balneola vulgaris TaxID=287535 RepID=UPI000476D8CE|nr:N-acylneuraminate cytidylyltransferase [Balneola vulgaris]